MVLWTTLNYGKKTEKKSKTRKCSFRDLWIHIYQSAKIDLENHSLLCKNNLLIHNIGRKVNAYRDDSLLTRYISSKSNLAQFLPRSSGSTGSPCPCGVEDISALRKQPFWVSATRVKPKPGDLQLHFITVSLPDTELNRVLKCLWKYPLPRVCSFHVVRVDVDVWDELVEDSPGWLYNPVGHLRRNSYRVSEFLSQELLEWTLKYCVLFAVFCSLLILIYSAFLF